MSELDQIVANFVKTLEESQIKNEEKAKKEIKAFGLEQKKHIPSMEVLNKAKSLIPKWLQFIEVEQEFDNFKEGLQYINEFIPIIHHAIDEDGNAHLYTLKDVAIGKVNMVTEVQDNSVKVIYKVGNFVIEPKTFLILREEGFVQNLTAEQVIEEFQPVEPAVVNKPDVECLQIKQNPTFEEVNEILDFFHSFFHVQDNKEDIEELSMKWDVPVIVKNNDVETGFLTITITVNYKNHTATASFNDGNGELLEGCYICDTCDKLGGYTIIPSLTMDKMLKEEEPVDECPTCKLKVEHIVLSPESVMQDELWPVDISVFPNILGINLCSVDSIDVTHQYGCRTITINFLPYEADYSDIIAETSYEESKFKVPMSYFKEEFVPSIEHKILTKDRQLIKLIYTE